MTPDPSTEPLLAELAWLRALARRLVSDPQRADDAVQDTLVAALTVGRPVRRWRGWLAAVLRNELRQEARAAARRDALETRVPPREPVPSAAALVEELAFHRRVVERLEALEEPYRRTLARRFLHGVPARQIAREEGVPVKTVHTRIERGLARMRERLDRDHGGRSAWVTWLLPLARSRPAVLSSLWFSMHAKTLSLCLGAAALGALLVVPRVVRLVEDAQPPAAESASLAPSAAVEPPVDSPEPGPQEARTPLRTAAPPPSPAAPLAEPARLRGTVVELDGRPVGGVEVAFEDRAGGSTPDAGATHSAADGSFVLELPVPRGRLTVRSERYSAVVRPYLDGALPTEPVLVVVAPSRDYGGHVVDTAGLPVAGARVVVSLEGDFVRSARLQLGSGDRTVHVGLPLVEGETDDQGRFAFAGVGRIEGAFVAAARDGLRPARRALPDGSRLDLELVLAPAELAGRWLHGIVLDAQGAPVADALVSQGLHSVRSGPAGRFALEAQSWLDGAPLRAVKAGHLPAELAFSWSPGGPGTDAAFPLVLTLGPAPLAIRGRVVDEHGDPVAGVRVWTPETTHFGEADYRNGSATMTGISTVERLVAGREEGGPWELDVHAESGRDGAFELAGLLDREYALYALDPDTLAAATPLLVEAGRSGVRLVLESAAARRRVAGHVVSQTGVPLAGVRLAPGRSVHWERPTPRPVAGWDRSPIPAPGTAQAFLDHPVTTDADGAFAFAGLHVEGASLDLTGPELLLATNVRLDPAADLEALEIVVQVPCRFVVCLSDPSEADAFGRVNEAGTALPLFVHVEEHVLSTPAVDLVEGRSGPVQVEAGPCLLELRKDGEVVRRVEVVLEAGGPQELWL